MAATCSPQPDSIVSSSNISRCGSALATHPGPKRAASPLGSMAPEPSAPPVHRDQQPTPSVASRCRPERVAKAAAVPPPAGARAEEGRAQCAGSPSTAPARAPVRPTRAAPGAGRATEASWVIALRHMGGAASLWALYDTPPVLVYLAKACGLTGPVPRSSPPRFLNRSPEVARAWQQHQLKFPRCEVWSPFWDHCEVFDLRPLYSPPGPSKMGALREARSCKATLPPTHFFQHLSQCLPAFGAFQNLPVFIQTSCLDCPKVRTDKGSEAGEES